MPEPAAFETWNPSMKALIKERSWVKSEIMFYFYGATEYTSVHGSWESFPMSLTYKEAAEVSQFVRGFLDQRFKVAFEFKKVLGGIIKAFDLKKKPLTWTFQGNTIKNIHYLVNTTKLSIHNELTPPPLNKYEVHVVTETHNTKKHVNKVLTNLNHSTDASLMVQLRIKLLALGVVTSSVHDCIGLPPQHYKVACNLYKELLVSEVFNKPLSSILGMSQFSADEQLKLLALEGKVNLLKSDVGFKGLTLREGYPLYPD